MLQGPADWNPVVPVVECNIYVQASLAQVKLKSTTGIAAGASSLKKRIHHHVPMLLFSVRLYTLY